MMYFFYVLLEIIFTIVCYLTNPIVVLFADEYGNLPYSLRYWQTWDNTLDVEWMITENKVPKIFQYDYGKHYKYIYEDHDKNIPGHVNILNPNFTLIERFKRYFCRLAWLYRNTGYGFSYEVTGKDINGADIIKRSDINKRQYRNQIYHTDDAFMIRYEKPWCKYFKWRIFLGWKMQDVDSTQTKRCMLALYVSPFWGVNHV